MAASVSGAAASAPTRPTGKLSVVTAGTGMPVSGGTENGLGTPRTPRRESAKGFSNGRSKATHTKQATSSSTETAAGTVASHSATHDEMLAADGLVTTVGGSSGGEGAAASSSRQPTSPSRRWGLIRKGVIPNPAIMKVNEKVVQIIQTLRKPPEDRTESDIKLLYTWLMNQEKLSSLFTTMSEISAKKLCKEMEFLHLESGDVVVNQGEKGNTCFILVSGMVSVFVRSSDEQKKYHRVTRATVDGSTSRALMEQGLITFGAKVATLTPGATFGELCLIEPDSKRSATVIVDAAAQVANFIVLTAASYLRMTRSQTIEGTITDHIAFLQHSLLFRKWTKMQLMHLVNSMKLVSVPAGQHIAHKGTEADSFFMLLRGEAQECIRLMLNEHSDIGVGENRSVQHCITVQLTFLGKFDVAGEYLAAEKKVVTCPVDIRAVTDVDCLVLNRKLFNLHFGGKDLKKHAAKALKRLRTIAQQRETWRETRIDQALRYPNLRVPITRKLMRLSGNCCLNCGRDTHVAGDELCMELAIYRMDDEKKKKQHQSRENRAVSKHRISIVVPSQAQSHVQAAVAKVNKANASRLPALSEDAEDDDDDENHSGSSEDDVDRETSVSLRLGHRLVRRQWKAAERAGLSRLPQRPSTTPASSSLQVQARDLRITSITHAQHISKRTLLLQRQGEVVSVEDEVRRIRASWPYGWRDLDPVDNQDSQPHFERLYRNSPRTESPMRKPRSAR